MSDEPLREELALCRILAEVEAGTIRLHRNVLDEPYVVTDHSEFPRLGRHLFDRDVRGWIANFVWTECNIVLREYELNRVLEVLAGRSQFFPMNEIEDVAALQFLENEPVVATLYAFMYDKNRHEEKMQPLWNELKELATNLNLLVRGRNRFPSAANVLSRKLTLLKPVLKQLHIDVDIQRSNGSNVTLTRSSDDPHGQSSTNQPSPNSNNHKPLEEQDDRKVRLKRLEEKRNANR